MEIRDLDKRYFKKRLNEVCIDTSILPLASSGNTNKSQQLFYHTFRLLTHGDTLERIHETGFPHSSYHLLRKPEPTRSSRARSELWHIQGTHYGEFQDCYLVNTVNACGEQIAIFVTMSKLDKRVGGTSLECGDFVRITVSPIGLLHYEVLDEISLNELDPNLANWLEDPDTAMALKQYLGIPRPAQ
jgi:hypothetical protein